MKNRNFKLLSLISALTLIAASAATSFAEESDGEHTSPPALEKGDGHGPCGDQDLTAAQKKEMKEEHFKFEEKKIDLESETKHARLNFEKIASNPKSSDSDIEKAAEAVGTAQSKMIMAEELFHAHVIAKILKPEQREKAMKCHMMMGPHHSGGDMGHGHEHGKKEHH